MKRRIGKKAFILALKIGVGSSTAFSIANMLNLENAASAGTITLLTILTTKWETIRLSWARIVTYVFSVSLSFILYHLPIDPWLMYAVYVFLLVLINEVMEWKNTLSVNAVIGIHFLTTRDFSFSFIINEFLLVLIGITIAYIMNMFRHNRSHQMSILSHIDAVEEQLRCILTGMAEYLKNQEEERDVWEELEQLEADLKDYILDAYEYEGNTFHSHSGYYLSYFEMRLEQCMEFYNLHTEMKRVRRMPAQAASVAEYMLYLREYVKENNCPQEQLDRLYELMNEMREQPLPQDYEEFENRAMLYHILSRLEAFIEHKGRFVKGLDEYQKQEYWNQADDCEMKKSKQ